MNLYEFQAKEILARHGVPIPAGHVAESAADAEARANELPGEKFAVKAQIHAGGRGIAGGVRLAATPRNVRAIAEEMIGSRLVTEQTRKDGEEIKSVYVEAAVDSEFDLFVAVLVDQATGELTIIGSKSGGVDFEKQVKLDPDIVVSLPVSLDGTFSQSDGKAFLSKLGLEGELAERCREVLSALARVFVKIDASLVEVNPLTITKDNQLLAVDAKITLDNNARFRHPEFDLMAAESVIDEVEMRAQKDEINLVRMDGNIGMVTNGAGLALATQDILMDAGGKPANFMDIRTTATSLQVARGIGLLLADPKIKVLLINVHGGGMTTCDTVVEALAFANAHADRKLPVVFRAAGQNADYARMLLKDRRIAHEPVDSISDAVKRAIALAA